MIDKIRSFQESRIVKGILGLTALSFMSLFGITGYLGSAGKNKPVIQVGSTAVFQEEISRLYQRDMQMLSRLTGEDGENNEALRNSLLQGIVQKELSKAIINETADDYNVKVGDDLIRQIIFSQAEFINPDGRFNMDKFRRLLQTSNMSEKEYIELLRQDILKQHLVQTPVEELNTPKTAESLLNKIANQRKTFKYILINPDMLNVDRKISDEELEQYYEDFSVQFIEPEKRDVSFLVISSDSLAKKIMPSDAEIKAYYQENIDQFVIPEQRQVLQMAFDDEETANKAAESLKSGKDFYAVAKEFAGQDKAATELGLVSKDMLIADMADEVFSAKINEVVGPFQSDMGWHIMKAVKIVPVKETKLEAAKNKIIDALRQEQAYEQAMDASREIEDEIGSGKGLDEIASEYQAKIYNAKGLSEDGNFVTAPGKYSDLIKSADFIDTAFSYNQGEISQILETEDGFALLRVDNITDAHNKEISEVKDEIAQMWEENEKSAIMQEIVNDVLHDMESGDKIEEVAARFKLSLNSSAPITREGSFAGLNKAQIAEIFHEKVGSAKVLDLDGKKMIVTTTKIINDQRKPSKEAADVTKFKFQSDLSRQAADTLIKAYGKNYKTKVKYKNIGLLEDE